jgi:hypothetical protein
LDIKQKDIQKIDIKSVSKSDINSYIKVEDIDRQIVETKEDIDRSGKR